MEKDLCMIHRAISILIHHFVRNISTCFLVVCISPAKVPLDPRGWRQIDMTSSALTKLCHSIVVKGISV